MIILISGCDYQFIRADEGKSTFHRYSQVPSNRGMTGADVARYIFE